MLCNTALVFRAEVDGQALTFQLAGWPLAGETLQPVIPLPSFWFSWAQFFPATEIYLGTSD